MTGFKGKIGVIGAGNLGTEVIEALHSRGFHDIVATRRSKENLDELKGKYESLEVSLDNTYAAKECDVIILAVKPKVIEEVASEIALYVKGKLVISLAAAKTIKEIEGALKSDARVSRVMTGLFVKDEIAAYSLGSNCTEDDGAVIRYIFGEKSLKLPEELLAHRGWIGCDTGLLPKAIEVKIDALAKLGMDPEQARIFYAAMLGAVAKQLESGVTGNDIINKVGEEGSFTKRNDDYLTEKGFYDLLRDCVNETVKVTGGKK